MKKIFGLNFYSNSLKDLIIDLEKVLQKGEKVKIYTPNVDHIINIKCNENIFNDYKVAEYIIADGWPIVLTSKIKRMPINKITGVDLMDKLLKVADEKKLDIFLLGATDETLEKLKYNLSNEFYNIKSINFNNGYFDIEDNEKIIEKINKSNSKILFVGMGSPKQELWITKNIDKLNINIVVGVGGALKIYSKEVDRAPRFIQSIGMEWFYRFLKEPTRLFNRYFFKYPKFIKYFIHEIFKA